VVVGTRATVVHDEFPTLEAALAVSLLVLAWRLGLLVGRLKHQPKPSELNPKHGVLARGRAGKDVAIAAVLGGALIYARAAHLDVSDVFYALGLAAFLLLLASAFVHARLTPRSDGGPRRSRKAALCPECGAASFTALGADGELGRKLAALGVADARGCRKCGYLQGRAQSGTW
jgi:hypothetical protein